MTASLDRRAFLRLAGGGVVLSATASLGACTSDLPPEAIAAWGGPPTSETEPRRWALSYALLAPHSHNLQSWLADLREPGVITLSVDRKRLLPQTDPFSRQILMSQGTFLELLVMACAEQGLRADVQLFPQGEFGPREIDDRPVARVQLLPDPAVRRDPLFAQVLRRRTNRLAYDPARPPAAQTIAGIVAAAASPALRCGVTGPGDASIARQRAIANEAWAIELRTPRTLMESYRWLRVGPSEIARERDGLSMNDPFIRAVTAVGLFDRTKAPAPGDANIEKQVRDFEARIASTPAFFWMVSTGNDRRTQVAAGRAYVRAQLAATAAGLSMHPLQQALQEYPEQAATYAAIHDLLGAKRPDETVQMWARLGVAPEVQPAPRRGLQAHLVA
jgi:hypothetical protein